MTILQHYTHQSLFVSPLECDQCGHGALCNISDKGVSCSCAHIECLASMEPVCSLNGQTYCNHCAAELASCQLQEAVVILYEGECEEDGEFVCFMLLQ